MMTPERRVVEDAVSRTVPDVARAAPAGTLARVLETPPTAPAGPQAGPLVRMVDPAGALEAEEERAECEVHADFASGQVDPDGSSSSHPG